MKMMYEVTLVCINRYDYHNIDNQINRISWATVADTPNGAIERCKDDIDLSGVEIIKWEVKESRDPVFIKSSHHKE